MAAPVRVIAAAPVAISQSTMIVGALIAFFILWLAANGKLATYWQFLTGGGKSASSSASSSPGSTGVLPPFLTPGAPGSIVPSVPQIQPNVPFGPTWWGNFLRPWTQ